MMSGEVSSAAIDAPRGVVGLADDVEVGLALEDVGDADAEQGVVVDDEDPDPLVDWLPPVGPPRRRSGPS